MTRRGRTCSPDRGSTAAGDRRPCKSQKSQGLRSYLLRPGGALCYSFAVFPTGIDGSFPATLSAGHLGPHGGAPAPRLCLGERSFARGTCPETVTEVHV